MWWMIDSFPLLPAVSCLLAIAHVLPSSRTNFPPLFSFLLTLFILSVSAQGALPPRSHPWYLHIWCSCSSLRSQSTLTPHKSLLCLTMFTTCLNLLEGRQQCHIQILWCLVQCLVQITTSVQNEGKEGLLGNLGEGRRWWEKRSKRLESGRRREKKSQPF